MPMKPAGQVLALLRTQPKTACAAWGFMCRGLPLSGMLGGGCTLTCTENNGVYDIDVAAGGADWYIPYGASAARYCDVPTGQPDGTLVVTFPMNGCALEVHASPTPNHNRFYHDADGKHMPNLDTAAKVRVDADMYEGPGARASTIFSRYDGSRGTIGQNFEHTIVCVKQGGFWNVYQTAVVTTMDTNGGSLSSWQIKDGPPVHLGVFAD